MPDDLESVDSITEVWGSGNYFGNAKPTARVEVYRYWQMVPVAFTWNGRDRGPAHVWQEGGAPMELPTQVVKSISISRSIESDTATMTLVIKNAHETAGPSKAWQGKFSQRRSIDGAPVSNAPWSLPGADAWGDASGTRKTFSYGALAQGSMVKTYQGYGESRVITGVWIIDTVEYGSDGLLTANCRDVGALLVDQNLYFPLVPDQCYPTMFYSGDWNEQEGTGDRVGKPPQSVNYDDITDIVVCVASWGGFTGKIDAEVTGSEFTSVVSADEFDKKPPIDAIKTFRDAVGYTTLVTRDGTFKFSRTNQWVGNPDWTANEYNTLLEHRAVGSKSADRSAFVAAESDPYFLGSVSTEFPVPRHFSYNTYEDGARNQLHGMHRIAMMPIDHRMTDKEAVTLAELTGLRSWFQRRKGQVTVVGNPLMDVDQQILVQERTTWDHHLHYIHGIESTQDLDTGRYTMTLQTHWLGPDPGFAVWIDGGGHVNYNSPSGTTGAEIEGAGPNFTSHAVGAEDGAIGRFEMTPEYEP